jgi:hypothetical protein
LKGELEFEREQWTKLYNRYRDLLDWMLIFDH